LTGSYFGDLPKYLFGLEPAQLALWIDPLTNPIALLTIALIMGLVHLNAGLVVGVYKNASRGKYFDALAEQGIWFMLQTAAFILLGPMLGLGTPTAMMKYLAFGFIFVSLALILKTEGAIGLFSLTGFFGDVVSYSRILALALATGGIAMTMNLLASMVAGTPYVGFILAAVVFTIGQLFSFAMNSLGAFIHGLRLHYVEFFSKFYEGGGVKFKPLELRRKYTTLESEHAK
jgi:V/A-type H+-transporting ATPase subunit I